MLMNQVNTFITSLSDGQHYSTNTISAYRNDLTQFVTMFGGISNWSDLDLQAIQDCVADLNNRSYSTATIARKVAAFKQFLSFLHVQGHINQDFSLRISTPRVQPKPPKLLSVEHIDTLLAFLKDAESVEMLRNRALVYLMYAVDIRISELVALKLPDAEKLVLPPQIHSYLQDYIQQGRSKLLRGENDPSTLFLNHRGTALTRQGAWLIIRRCAELAGLPTQVTPRILRQSFNAHHRSESKA